MRMILISLLMLMSGSLAASATPNYEYIFKPQEECANPSHATNIEALKTYETDMFDVAVGVQEANWWQEAWLETVKPDTDPTQYNDVADMIFFYKSYKQQAAMFVAFQDGCFIGFLTMPLDKFNLIYHKYEEKKKGL